MVKLIFKDGTNLVDPATGVQPPFLERIKDLFDEALLPLKCPNHLTNSYATLMLNVEYNNSDWEIIDFCCTDFSHVIENEMPFPWSHAQRHQKS